MIVISPKEDDWVIEGALGVCKIIKIYEGKGISSGYCLDPTDPTKLLEAPIHDVRIKKVIDNKTKIKEFEENLKNLLLEGGI